MEIWQNEVSCLISWWFWTRGRWPLRPSSKLFCCEAFLERGPFVAMQKGSSGSVDFYSLLPGGRKDEDYARHSWKDRKYIHSTIVYSPPFFWCTWKNNRTDAARYSKHMHEAASFVPFRRGGTNVHTNAFQTIVQWRTEKCKKCRTVSRHPDAITSDLFKLLSLLILSLRSVLRRKLLEMRSWNGEETGDLGDDIKGMNYLLLHRKDQ